MANTATSFYIDTLGSGSRQTGHPEFELSEAIGNSPYTMELWYKYVDLTWTGWSPLISITNTTVGADNTTLSSAGGDMHFMVFYDSGNPYYENLIYGSGGEGSGAARTNDYNGGNIVRDGNWHHIAHTREFDGFCGFWHDGVLIGDGPPDSNGSDSKNTSNRELPGKRVELGFNRPDGGNYPFKGYMDEFRISKKVRYGNIDTPTAPHNTWQTAGRGKNSVLPVHTVFLAQSNATATTSDSLRNQGSVPGTWTVYSGATGSTEQSLTWANTALLKCDSNDRAVFTQDSGNDLTHFQSDFSIEVWCYPTAESPAGDYGALLTGWSGDSLDFYFTIRNSNNVPTSFSHYNGTSPNVSINEGTRGDILELNQWNHLAVAKIGLHIYLYYNGQLINQAAAPASLSIQGDNPSSIGIGYWGNQSGRFFTGYVDGVRICNGQSAYTPNFIPYGGQKNVVHNRGGAVTDARHASANTHAIQMGRAAIGSDHATNANTYCLNLNGTNQYLMHTTPAYRSSDDRGTIFAWVYLDTTQAGVIFASMDTAGGGSHYDWLYLRVDSNGKLDITKRHNDGTQSPGATTLSDSALSTGQWYSVAVVADGTNNWVLYVDGSAVSVTTSGAAGENGNWLADLGSTDNITIGAYKYGAGTGDFFDGKIMQVAYFGGSVADQGVLTAAQISALHSAGKSHDLTTATGVYTASEIDDLKGYWRMGNHYLDTPSVIYDASGNGYDMKEINGSAATFTFSGTGAGTFHNGWQDRGYFDSDKYTSLLIQSSHNEGNSTFRDRGPGFKRMHFDGTNDYAEKTGISNYRQGDDRGTVNAWIKLNDYTSRGWFCVTDTSGTNSYYYIYSNADGLVTINRGDTIMDRTINAISTGVWTMVTVTNEAAQDPKFYVDGVLWESHAVTRGSGSPSNPAYTGNERWFGDISGLDLVSVGNLAYGTGPTRSDYFDGDISQVAVWSASSGTNAVLTASQISAIYDLGPGGNVKTSYSSGLVDYWTMGNQIGEGTDDASTIYSQVTGGQDLTTAGSMAAPFAGHTITTSGAYHSTARSVFGGSSIYFDGTNDKLTVPASPDWNYGTGDFTIEFWMNTSVFSSYKGLICNANGTNNDTEYLRIITSTPGYVQFRLRDGASGNEVNVNSHGAASAVMSTNVWYHVACVRNNGVMELYVDGIFQDSATSTHNHTWGSTEGLKIGLRRDSDYYSGYIDEIRYATGIARYTKSIERFANTFVAKGDTGDAFTVLQIQSNGAKNGAGYSDGVNRTGYNTSAVTLVNGGPIWRNTVGDPFGGSNTALYFDHPSGQSTAGAHLSFADSGDFDLGNDWTIETWVNFEDLRYHNILSKLNTSSASYYYFAYNHSAEQIIFGANSLSAGAQGVFSAVVGRWYHIAASSTDGVCSVFADGVFLGSAGIGSVSGGGDALYIGREDDGSPNYWGLGGYLDQIRISKGIGRYGKYQLRTTQQTHVSANSDSGVVTSNSTFGSGDNILSTDGQTSFLLTGDELYSNTHVSGSGNAFLMSVGDTNVSNVTSFITVTVGTGVRRDGTSGNIYYFDGFGRAPLTLVRDNHYQFYISDSDYAAHPFKFSTTAGGTHGGGTEYTTGVTVDTDTYSGTNYTLVKFSPTSATPDSLHYYCSSHNNMGHTASVVDSTGSDGVIAPRPVGITKGDGTTTTLFPAQRQGISAYGANSYFFDGGDYISTPNIPDLFTPQRNGTADDFTMEIWYHQTASSGTWSDLFAMKGYWNSGDGLILYINGQSPKPYYNQAGSGTAILDAGTYPMNTWHHYAVQSKNGIFEVYLNGILRGTKDYGSARFDDETNASLFIGGRSNPSPIHFPYTGFVDEPRFSKGVARYGYTGTNTKLGTNAVHHSNAKLLITSNTFNGNTHFDDFSDQGNYWNVQPTSIWSDGYLEQDGGPSSSGTHYFKTTAYNVSNTTAKTLSFWVFPENITTGTTGYSLVGAQEGGAYQYAGYREDGQFYGYIGSNSQIAGNTSDVVAGQWQLITLVQDGTNAYGYVNGQEVATATSVAAGNNGTEGYGLNAVDSGLHKVNGRVSNFAVWEGKSLSASEVLALWNLGPTGNWIEDTGPTSYADDLAMYFAMGNHNNLGGRPADTTSKIYDRSGNGRDTTSGTTTSLNKGAAIKEYGTVKHSTDRKHKGSSAIFFDGDSDYLEMMPHAMGPASTTCDLTFEAWVAFTGGDSDCPACIVTSTQTGNSNEWYIRLDGSDYLSFYSDSLSATLASSTAAYDTIVDNQATWHHVVGQRKATKVELYLDGIKVADSGTTGTGFTAGGDRDMVIGKREWSSGTGSGQYWKGYMDEIAYYHGVAKYSPVVTGLGTATITPSYLPDPTGNHFTASGLTITDQMLDSPENNFCTLNPLGYNLVAPSEGNLKAATTVNKGIFGTMAFTKGKWYHEVKAIDGYGSSHLRHGYFQYTGKESYQVAQGAGNFGDNGSANYIENSGTTTVNIIGIDSDGTFLNVTANAIPASSGGDVAGDVYMFALDLDDPNGKAWFGKNGQWYAGNPARGEDPLPNSSRLKATNLSFPDAPWTYGHFVTDNITATEHINFGQGDPDGENNFTDSNGRGGFRYEPPQGFLSWCTANMKDADFAPIGPNSAAGTPDKHFDTLLYTASGYKDFKIRGLAFQPDLVWIKNRDRANEHMLYDSVRGAGKDLNPDSTSAEATNTNALADFNAGGFTLGDSGTVNYINENHVAWCWKAGNGTTVNNDGTIQTTVSVNRDAGFSIVSYISNGSAGSTIGHGLDSAPEMIIGKNRDRTYHWAVYNKVNGAANGLRLNTTDANLSGFLNSTEPSSSVITLGTYDMNMESGDNQIMYCWHSVEGYSKFGSYEGNNSADGPFVYLGFKPAWVMVKEADNSGNWIIWDNKRNPHNPTTLYHVADATDAEVEAGNPKVDFLSNGFKLRGASGSTNTNGSTHIYMAFAEMPFKYANAR